MTRSEILHILAQYKRDNSRKYGINNKDYVVFMQLVLLEEKEIHGGTLADREVVCNGKVERGGREA